MTIRTDRPPTAGFLRDVSARIAAVLARYLSAPRHIHGAAAPCDPDRLRACLAPGDVLLVEGNTRISVAIKYLTQSTWSHAALYVGEQVGRLDPDGRAACFVEADLRDGVRAVGMEEFAGLHCRICRPIGLAGEDVATLVRYAIDRIGQGYDLRNVIDLARYLLPTPPVPTRWRRRMLALGSGDPTRAICSTLIAQVFQAVRYPILPLIEHMASSDPACPGCVDEIHHVRHHSLFVPRDFDVSPYFQIVKPHLASGFDPRRLVWRDDAGADRSGGVQGRAAAQGQQP